jgi:hypothetical protein
MAGTPQTVTLTLLPTDVQVIALGLVQDGTTTTAPIPAGDTFAAVSPSAAIGVVVDNTADTVTVNALTLPSPNTMGMAFAVTDSAGDTRLNVIVNYPPLPVVNDIAGTVTVNANAQPAPTAPGP